MYIKDIMTMNVVTIPEHYVDHRREEDHAGTQNPPSAGSGSG